MSAERRAMMKAQLGVNPSTAGSALKKQIMFHMAKKLGMDNCFQCGEKIETVKEFSVEHKIPWLHSENAKELYFDIDNIAFSHLSCNCKAARKPSTPVLSAGERKAKEQAKDRKRKNNDEYRAKRRKMRASGAWKT
jgi:hypothetical protein